MPIVTVQIARERDVDTKRRLVEAVTQACIDTLGARRDVVTVLIEVTGRENWATGGVLHLDGAGPVEKKDMQSK